MGSRLRIDAKEFEAMHELEEFGTVLENVLPDWEERGEKRVKQYGSNRYSCTKDKKC